MDDLVPQYLSRRETSVLTLLCRDKIDDFVAEGILHDHRGGRGWSRIPTAEVERVRGRPVTATDYLAAKLTAREVRNRQPCRQRVDHVGRP